MTEPGGLLDLMLSCLRIGTLVFGGGYVFIPMMEADVVHRYGWLTKPEFTDAVALGHMTPGPILVSATVVGYKVAGIPGAILATLCMFLPSFIMTLLAVNYLERIKKNKTLNNFLWGVRAAVVGLVLAGAFSIAQDRCNSIPGTALALLALIALVWKKVDAGIVVVTCGLLGLAIWPGTGA